MIVAITLFLLCFAWAVKRGGKKVALAVLVLLAVVLGTEAVVLTELIGSSPDLTYNSDTRFHYEAALGVLDRQATQSSLLLIGIAFGLQVVASALGTFVEGVPWVGGVLVSPNDPSVLAQALLSAQPGGRSPSAVIKVESGWGLYSSLPLGSIKARCGRGRQ